MTGLDTAARAEPRDERGPVRPALSLRDGRAFVVVRGHVLAPGVTLLGLDLEVPDVDFPVDARGGPARFQHHATRLRSAALELELGRLAGLFTRALPADGPLVALSLSAESGAVVAEARLASGRARARERSRYVVLPGPGRAVRALPVEWVRVGAAGVPADAVAEAMRAVMSAVPGGRALAPEVDAQGALVLDPLAAVLWATLPPAGWKLPAHEAAAVTRAYVTAEARLVLVFGADPHDVALPAEDPAAAREALLAHAREDATQLAVDGAVGEGATGRFMALRASLDEALGPPGALERALMLGASEPALAVDVADLVGDALVLHPDHPVALSVRADLASARGESAQAIEDWVRAADGFAAGGRARLAGFAQLAAAAKARGARRTACLEAALAALGDDPEVLRALVEDLVAHRQSGAVAVARRLARAATVTAEKVWAHVAAGDVLRGVLGEPIAAKREYERALLLDPDDGAALEGLAEALSAQGDPRRAAAILERLFARAMTMGDRGRASALSVALGDLWRPLDWSAAVARWRRASELDPRHAPAIERLARAAAEAPDEPSALDAAERALALAQRASVTLPDALERALRLRAAAAAARAPGRQAEVAAHAEAVLARSPDDPDALAVARGSVLDPARRAGLLARAAEALLARGDVAAAAALVREEAELRARVPEGDGVDRAALARRAEAVLAALPGNLDALDALVAVDPRPGSRARALRARLAATPEPEAHAALTLALAEVLVDDGEAHHALEVAASVVAQPVPAARWVALAGALGATAAARDVPRLLALAAAHASPDGARTLARAEAVARERLGDTPGAYEARARGSDGTADDLAELVRLATQLGRHGEARAWLARWDAAVGSGAPRTVRARWLSASADAALAAGDADGEIAALEALIALGADVSPADARGALAHPDVLAQRLAQRLAQAGRHRSLALLERRRALAPGTPVAGAIDAALAAAEAWTRVGDDGEAAQDLERVIDWGAGSPLASAQVGQALDALERLARRRSDPSRVVAALERRVRFVVGAEARARVRLQQADVLAAAGAWVESLARVEQARAELPRSRAIATRLAREAKRQGLLDLWATAEAQLATLADDEGDRAAAIGQHAQAADALAETGRLDEAAAHDRVVVERGLGELELPRLERSLRRLERHARATGDEVLLDEVLERWAEIEPPVAAVERLYERAERELSLRGPGPRALAALRRARARAGDDGARARELDARIAEVLTALERWEELSAHAVARGDRAAGARRAAAYLEAARVLEERLNQRSAALERTRAALEADPANPAARAHRRRLLRETARGNELAEALLEDAKLSAHAEEQASLRLEAADILAPISDAAAITSTAALARALDIARDVERGAPRWAAPHRRVATYARLLARFDEEYLALDRLAAVTDDPVERSLAVWRRVELARGPLEDPVGAQAELHELIQIVEALDQERQARLREQLERTPYIVRPDGVSEPLDALLALGTALTAETRDFETHLRYLERQLARAPDARARADLHFRIGETREWKLGDGDAAERAYLAALRELSEHERGRRALRGLYLAVDRFGDLAENLGIQELWSLWQELAQGFAGERQIAAGEALWPRLPRGTAERARVLLATADLYRTVRDEAEGAVMLLELVTREGPAEFEPAALERLRVLFLEEGRNDLYVEILRRQADRAEGDTARARALAEVGEALEWKLGDGAGAELEYRTALAADPGCALARERLGLLLSSQDRFDELAADLGVEALEREALALAARGRREGARLVRAADALVSCLPETRRAALWGELIEREPDPELRRRLMAYGPVSSVAQPADAPPEWEDAASQTHFELPAVAREEPAEALEEVARARPSVKLTVVADPVAEVVRLVPRASETPAPPPDEPAEVVPFHREDAEGAWDALIAHIPAVEAESAPLEVPSAIADAPEPGAGREDWASWGPMDRRVAAPSADGEAAASPQPASPEWASFVGSPPALARDLPPETSAVDPEPPAEPGIDVRPAEAPPTDGAAEPDPRAGSGPDPAPAGAEAPDAPIAEPRPSTRWLRLAERARGGEPRAAALLLRGASRWPPNRPAVAALDTAASRALLHALTGGAAGVPLPELAPLAHLPPSWRRLIPPQLDDPLGRLLARAAGPLAAVLPPRALDTSARHPVDDDAPLAQAARALSGALDLELTVERDPSVRGVAVEPGEPPVLVAGADVTDDALGTYKLARAAFLLRSGGLLVDAPDAAAWVRTLTHLIDLRPDEDPAAGLLRARLGPSGLAEVEGLAERARGQVDLAAWAAAVEVAASVFAAAWSGEVAPLLDAADPRPHLAAWLGERTTAWLLAARPDS